jgi:glycosyltransferase involved in cell wall biosynthesis/SAM-dependent methyltransferase
MVMRSARAALRRLGRGSRAAPPATVHGAVDNPLERELWRVVPVTFEGWALNGAAPAAGVDVVVGNNAAIHANIGLSRPDVPVDLDDAAISEWSGWRIAVDLSDWPHNAAPIRVVARDSVGNSAVLLDRVFTIREDGFAGRIEGPSDEVVTGDSVLVVSGWAVLDGGPPARVDVSVDGVPVGNARLRIPGHVLPAGTPRAVGDFAGFEYRGSPAHSGSEPADIDISVTGIAGTVVVLPTRLVTFAPDCVSVVDSARATALRSRVLSLERSAGVAATPGQNPRPRLLVFTHGLGPSDSEMFLQAVLGDLMTDLDSCVVVSPTDGGLRTILEGLGAEVLVSGRAAACDVESYEGRIREVMPFITAANADVVLLNTLDVRAEADAAMRAGLPTIWALHQNFRAADWLQHDGAGSCHPYITDRLKLVLAASTRLVFESSVCSASFSGFADADRRTLTPRGVDIEAIQARAHAVHRGVARRRLGIPDDAVVLLSVGSFEEGQSQASVAEAFLRVASTHERAVLLLVGEQSNVYSHCLDHMVWASGQSDRLLMLPLADRWDLYALADVLVSASDTSVARHTVLEAMAFSLPVLATSVDGVQEVVSDGVSGWLCAARDLRALGEAIDLVLSLDPGDRSTMGQAAHNVVRRDHSASQIGPTYRRLMTELRSEDPGAVAEKDAGAGAEMRRLDQALAALAAVAETRLSTDAFPPRTSPARDSVLADFNHDAPFVRDGIASFIAQAAERIRPGARVVDIGAGDAPYRHLFQHVDYVTVDWEQSPHDGARLSDIIASADSIPLPDASVDAVVMTEVLEHVNNPLATLREMARILKVDGQIVLTTPFVWILHEMPHDYYRYTPSALRNLLEDAGFDQVEVTPRGDDYFSTLAQLMQLTPQWITAMAVDDGLDDRRHLVGKTMADVSPLFAALAPLDRQHLLPLGFNASARRPG